MRVDRKIRLQVRLLAFGLVAAAANSVQAQALPIVINEFVKDSRAANTAQEDPLNPNADSREFIELYNPNNSPVNIEGYFIRNTVLSTGASFDDVLPSGATIPALGYYVIAVEGRALDSIANHKIAVSASDSLFPDSLNLFLELYNPSQTLVDAVATDTYRAPQLAPTNPLTAGQLAQVGSGLRGRVESYNAPVTTMTYARYRDGVDSNKNGLDFGYLPVTPGASNHLAFNAAGHTPPNVDAMSAGTLLTDYNFAFVAPRVIAPGTVDAANPKQINASPQGGNAISVWDETGGGNVAYSKDYVNKFDLYAYLDSTDLDINQSDWEAEWTAYGIGSVDPQFRTPNPHGSIPTGGVATQSEAGNTGIGWFYERFHNDLNPDVNTFKLSLIDFGQGGNSVPSAQTGGADPRWNIIHTYELTNADSGWHRLSIDYDDATGEVVAIFGDNAPLNFTTDAGRTGTFYAAYREALSGVPASTTLDFVNRVRPATFDMIELATADNADFDGDGDVDGADFLTWQRGLGSNGDLVDGDANDDNIIDGADLAIWKAQFGPAAATPAAAAVPEPGSLGLMLLAACACLAGGKSRSFRSIT